MVVAERPPPRENGTLLSKIPLPATLKRLSESPVAVFVLLSLVIFAGNAYICQELFRTEYTQHMDSIEAAYISLSRWILEHPWDLKWFPLWYGGVPFENAYPPLLHVLTAVAAGAGGISPALAHHAVTAVMYCLGPVFLFWFAWRLSGDRWASFSAAALYSVVSPSALLIAEVAHDMGTHFASRRLHILVRYGEGPHVTAMALLPLALLALHWALERRRPVAVYAGMAGLAAVALTNWLGAFALAAAVACYLLARMDENWWRRALLAGAIGVLAYALASPWIPPSNLAAIRYNAQFTVGHFPMGRPQLAAGALLLLALGTAWLALRWLRASPMVQFAAYFSLVMGGMQFAWYEYQVHILPQPMRYHAEMGMALVLLVTFAVAGEARHLRRRALVVLLAICLVILYTQGKSSRRHARDLVRSIDITRTVEYQIARWLDENLSGSRIYDSGSTQFWLNAFSDNPQLGGGFAQGIVNSRNPHVMYGVSHSEENGQRDATWLRAYGADAVVVHGHGTRDQYQDFMNPAKFEGVLEEIWRDGADVIYRIPRRSMSLAHVIRPADIVEEWPYTYLEVDRIAHYDAALENPELPVARLAWRSPHEAVITAEMEPAQVLSVQISYHPGWRAETNGRRLEIRPDALEQMIIAPDCSGPCEVRLVYDGGPEMRAARAASVLALIAPVLAFRRRNRRKPA